MRAPLPVGIVLRQLRRHRAVSGPVVPDASGEILAAHDDRDRALDAISQILSLSQGTGTPQEIGFALGHINAICWRELVAAGRAEGPRLPTRYLTL